MQTDIAVLSPFRSQVLALSEIDYIERNPLQRRVPSNPNVSKQPVHSAPIDITTIDKFQGCDRDVIIISTVRRMNKGDGAMGIGTLLRDWRRINVGITRAKKKLIIIGSIDIMKTVPLLNELVH